MVAFPIGKPVPTFPENAPAIGATVNAVSNTIWRTTVIVHRYLGVLGSLLMLMWFLSGIVMVYVPYPRTSEVERIRTLPPIPWAQCCRIGDGLADDDETIIRARIENLNGAPTLRLQRPGRPDSTLDLAHGAALRVDEAQARAIALEAAQRIIGRPAAITASAQEPVDQWTIGGLQRDRPFYRFAFDDPERTNIYVSGTAGQVMHWTTSTQRFWNWLGTIPHFIYFLDLRRNPALWSQIVIWTSLFGAVLTALGLYLGIAQFRRGGKVSPYRGWFYWHHIAGLMFGLFTLTWAFSGLVSMNPWGFLEREGAGEEAQLLRGQYPKWNVVRASLDHLRQRPVPAQDFLAKAVNLDTAPFAGQLFWRATLQDGSVIRLDAAGKVAALTDTDLTQAAQRIAGAYSIAEQGLIAQEDTYFLQRRRDNFVLPVYRVVLGDEDQTRYYLDPRTGALLQRVDENGRWQRWLFSGLHRIDFTSWLRARPFWDVIILVLLLGGAAASATGVYLAGRRIKQDVVVVSRAMRGRRRASAS